MNSDNANNRRALMNRLSNIRFLARQGITYVVTYKEIILTSHRFSTFEMLKVMTLEVLRYVAASLHRSPFYSIMAHETTDSSTLEQVVICLRWVDNSLNAHNEFIGVQQVDKIDAATITFTIKDVLQRMNLRLTRARGQCYEGCSTLSVPKKVLPQTLNQMNQDPSSHNAMVTL